MKKTMFFCWMVVASALVIMSSCSKDQELLNADINDNGGSGGRDTINNNDTTRLKVIDGGIVDGTCHFVAWDIQKDSITTQGELIFSRSAVYTTKTWRAFEDNSQDTVEMTYRVIYTKKVNNFMLCAGKVSSLDSLVPVEVKAGAFTNGNWVSPVSQEVKVPNFTFGGRTVTPCYDEANAGRRSFGERVLIGENTYAVATTMTFPLHNNGELIYRYNATISFSEKNVKVLTIENVHARPNCDVLLYDQREINTVDTMNNRVVKDIALDLNIQIEISDTIVINQPEKPGYTLNSTIADTTQWMYASDYHNGSDVTGERMYKLYRYYIGEHLITIKVTMNRKFIKNIDGTQYAINMPSDQMAEKGINYIRDFKTRFYETYISTVSFNLLIGEVTSRNNIIQFVKELVERKDEITGWDFISEQLTWVNSDLFRKVNYVAHHSVIGDVSSNVLINTKLSISDNGVITTHVDNTDALTDQQITNAVVETLTTDTLTQVRTKTVITNTFGDQKAILNVTINEKANWRTHKLADLTPVVASELFFVKDSVADIYNIKVYQIVYTIKIGTETVKHQQKALVYKLNLEPTLPGYRIILVTITEAYTSARNPVIVATAHVEELLTGTHRTAAWNVNTFNSEFNSGKSRTESMNKAFIKLWNVDPRAALAENPLFYLSLVYTTSGDVSGFEPATLAGWNSGNSNMTLGDGKNYKIGSWDYKSIVNGFVHTFSFTGGALAGKYNDPLIKNGGAVSPFFRHGNFIVVSDK